MKCGLLVLFAAARNTIFCVCSRRLNSYIDEIMSDISERAPVLKKEREDYARLLEQVCRICEVYEMFGLQILQ